MSGPELPGRRARAAAALWLGYFFVIVPAWSWGDVCGWYGAAFEGPIRAKLVSGVPFELVAVVFEGQKLRARQSLRVSYDPWDEIVSVAPEGATARTFPLAKAKESLCRWLGPDPREAPRAGSRWQYRLLLNPLWRGRLARLRLESQGPRTDSALALDWTRIESELGNEVVVLRQDWTAP